MFIVCIHAPSYSAPLTLIAMYARKSPPPLAKCMALNCGGNTVVKRKQRGMTTMAKQAPAMQRRLCCKIRRLTRGGGSFRAWPPAAAALTVQNTAMASPTARTKIHNPMLLMRPVGSLASPAFAFWQKKMPQCRTSRLRRAPETSAAASDMQRKNSHRNLNLAVTWCFKMTKVMTPINATEIGGRYIQATKPTSSANVYPIDGYWFVPRTRSELRNECRPNMAKDSVIAEVAKAATTNRPYLAIPVSAPAPGSNTFRDSAMERHFC
mmetsp:Transcript_127384/g.248177  ORF Transcript_127384/g.248177 Transcript_127384/m.248177 type:complete len:266 (+) Transcript_127384:1992-2789(+)